MVVMRRSKDDSLWVKHIMGDDRLAAMLKGVPDGSRHRFRIGEREGVFEKMNTGKNAKPTDGFKPVGEIRDWWQRSKYDAAGSVVPFAYLGPDE
jgi:hypothetical protein